ncbi:hypothetical protein M8J77_002217 [Diaphorina citri]|nr:hypothetical protein M8J77_002217 [Diaphorina citri]
MAYNWSSKEQCSVCNLHENEDLYHFLFKCPHFSELRSTYLEKWLAEGKDCSMEQMTGIREQQEHLARLHFELGAQQELFAPLSDEGLRQGTENMHSLMSKLEKLSISIEKLHSFSNSIQD